MKYMEEEIFLGKDFSVSSDMEKTGLNNNVLVVGSSGAGKTMSVAEARLIGTKNSSLIVSVSKRSLVDRYKKYFAVKGYRVYDINFANPDKSDVFFDPMKYVSSDADITYLASSIVMADSQKRNSRDYDPFWDNASESLLSSMIAYIRDTKSDPSFSDVCDFFEKLKIREKGDSVETSLDDTFDRIYRNKSDSFAMVCWKTFRYAPMRTAGSIYSVLHTSVDKIFSRSLKKAMRDKPSVDFKNIGNEKSVLFVTTSAVNPSLDAFSGMFWSQAVKTLFEYAESCPGYVLPVPVHLLCDDFASGSKVPNFSRYISIFREKNISVSVFLQSESQLDDLYGKSEARTIINNCDTYVYMGGTDLETCKNIAEKTCVDFKDVMYMKIGDEIIFRRGMRPVLTQRYPITENEDWKKINCEY